jgi:hypothetical protein
MEADKTQYKGQTNNQEYYITDITSVAFQIVDESLRSHEKHPLFLPLKKH